MEAWDFNRLEERDGLRFSWNVWPSNRLEATRCVVPIGCLYTPLKQIAGLPAPLAYEPVRCSAKACQAVLNPFCPIDFRTKVWTCPFCQTRNQFPRAYAENIREDNLPAELYPQYTTLEYVMPSRSVAGPPVFLFVVDSYSDQEELDELKDSLQQALSLLPESALVGLITFGAMVTVHEIGFSECPKAHVFRGTKMHDGNQIQTLLGMLPPGARGRATTKSVSDDLFLYIRCVTEYFANLINFVDVILF